MPIQTPDLDRVTLVEMTFISLFFVETGWNVEWFCLIKLGDLRNRWLILHNSFQSFKDKYEETIETLSEVKTKLILQRQQKELYEKQHIEMIEILDIPTENRSFATILPAIRDLKKSLSLMQEQAETNHYTNAQALIESISNNNE